MSVRSVCSSSSPGPGWCAQSAGAPLASSSRLRPELPFLFLCLCLFLLGAFQPLESSRPRTLVSRMQQVKALTALKSQTEGQKLQVL